MGSSPSCLALLNACHRHAGPGGQWPHTRAETPTAATAVDKGVVLFFGMWVCPKGGGTVAAGVCEAHWQRTVPMRGIQLWPHALTLKPARRPSVPCSRAGRLPPGCARRRVAATLPACDSCPPPSLPRLAAQPLTTFKAFWDRVLGMPYPPPLPLPEPLRLPPVPADVRSLGVDEVDWFMTPEQVRSWRGLLCAEAVPAVQVPQPRSHAGAATQHIGLSEGA